MPITHWAVVNMDGELIGRHCAIMASSRKSSFHDYKPPSGYMKVLISQSDYEHLETSFNSSGKIYNDAIDPIESKVRELPEERKAKNRAKVRPNKYREKILKSGDMLIEFYDENNILVHTEVGSLEDI